MKLKLTEKLTLFFFIFLPHLFFAQKPREIQVDNEPPIWEDPAVIITLIVIPLVLIIFGVIWYKRRQRKLDDIRKQLQDQEKT